MNVELLNALYVGSSTGQY